MLFSADQHASRRWQRAMTETPVHVSEETLPRRRGSRLWGSAAGRPVMLGICCRGAIEMWLCGLDWHAMCSCGGTRMRYTALVRTGMQSVYNTPLRS